MPHAEAPADKTTNHASKMLRTLLPTLAAGMLAATAIGQRVMLPDTKNGLMLQLFDLHGIRGPVANGIPATNVARFDGTTWSAMDTGIGSPNSLGLEVEQIAELGSGELVAIGTHTQLLRDCPLYARLASLQFRDETPTSGRSESAPASVPDPVAHD